MTDVKLQQEVTVPLTDVSRGSKTLTDIIDEFIPGVRRYFKNIRGEEFSAAEEKRYRLVFSAWNTFLQDVQGVRDTSGSAITSTDIKGDMKKFLPWLKDLLGLQYDEGNVKFIQRLIPRWNMFIQARSGKTLVTWWNLFLTIMGFIFYLADMVSDTYTAIYYVGIRQWWRAIATLTIIYAAVIIHTVVKWFNRQIHCTGAADWIRYVASSLVNWPDVKQYWELCRLDWQMYNSPEGSAHLIPEWHQGRVNVARLKYAEGISEACPQAILQLYLLVPDLYGAWTWTDYLRIAGACVSLCTAGAALVNREKFDRIINYIDLPLSELVVLHVWAVPVTVSRLLSVTLLLSVHPYWALVGVALYLVLYGVYWCRTAVVPRALGDVIAMCLYTLQFCMSPFRVDVSVTYRQVYHVVHFLVNTAMTVVWAFGTPVMFAQPALYTAIICVTAVMFAVGLVGWQLHEYHWSDSYFVENND